MSRDIRKNPHLKKTKIVRIIWISLMSSFHVFPLCLLYMYFPHNWLHSVKSLKYHTLQIVLILVCTIYHQWNDKFLVFCFLMISIYSPINSSIFYQTDHTSHKTLSYQSFMIFNCFKRFNCAIPLCFWCRLCTVTSSLKIAHLPLEPEKRSVNNLYNFKDVLVCALNFAAPPSNDPAKATTWCKKSVWIYHA